LQTQTKYDKEYKKYMKKFLSIALLIILSTAGIYAQSIGSSSDAKPSDLGFNSKGPTKSPVVKREKQAGSSDYKTGEIFVGYSFSDSRVRLYNRDGRLRSISSLDRTFSLRDKFKRGFTASGVYNFSRFVGAKADFSYHFNDRTGKIGTRNFAVKERLSNYLVGIQVKDNAKEGTRFRPFAHGLVGFSRSSTKLADCSGFGTTCPTSLNQRRYGLTYGGGAGLDIKASEKVTIRVMQIDYLRGKVADGLRFSTGIVF
jgi:opacity protein-like surface antigen